MSPRRALFFALAGALLLGARAALFPPPPPGPADARRDEPPALLFLGGFRPVVADALWVRMIVSWDSGEYDEVLPLAEALLTLDPSFEQAWFVAAWTLAVDLPPLVPGPERAPRVRQGLLLLRDGVRKNPRSWFLRYAEGFLIWQHIAPDPALAARLQVDRAGAARLFEEAAALPGHPVYVDWAVIRAALEAGRGDDARRAIAHVRAAHPEASAEQVNAFERAAAGDPPPR